MKSGMSSAESPRLTTGARLDFCAISILASFPADAAEPNRWDCGSASGRRTPASVCLTAPPSPHPPFVPVALPFSHGPFPSIYVYVRVPASSSSLWGLGGGGGLESESNRKSKLSQAAPR